MGASGIADEPLDQKIAPLTRIIRGQAVGTRKAIVVTYRQAILKPHMMTASKIEPVGPLGQAGGWRDHFAICETQPVASFTANIPTPSISDREIGDLNSGGTRDQQCGGQERVINGNRINILIELIADEIVGIVISEIGILLIPLLIDTAAPEQSNMMAVIDPDPRRFFIGSGGGYFCFDQAAVSKIDIEAGAVSNENRIGVVGSFRDIQRFMTSV